MGVKQEREQVEWALATGQISWEQAEAWRRAKATKYIGIMGLALLFLLPPLGVILLIIWLFRVAR